MRPALGVTEPAAIAFAVATAKNHTTGILQKAHVVLNSGMYKNAFTCGIPNSNEVGNAHAAALGYVAADATKGLECLDSVTNKHNVLAKKLLADGKINVSMGEISSRIYIHVTLTTDNGTASVTITDAHTNITEITENGRVVFSKKQEEKKETEEWTPLIHRYTLRQILLYAKTVPLDEIAFISKAYDLNLSLFDEAIKSRRTSFAHFLYNKNGRKKISSDEQASASLL